MPLAPTLKELTEARLLEACSNQYAESQTLEFKRELPSKSDRDEFLKDVCALANADGGDIVYGIEEDKAKAKAVAAITVEAFDAARRRLGQTLDSGMEPRLAGIQFHEVPISSGGFVMVLRIPKSFVAPHRVIASDGSRRFVVRNGTHTTDLTYDQLRLAFDRTATLGDRVRRFRLDRIGTIEAGQTWRPLKEGPLAVLHLLPLSSASGQTAIDIFELHEKRFYDLALPSWGGASRATNLDGLVVHPGSAKDGLFAYVHVFRTGALEAATFSGRIVTEHQSVPSLDLANFFRDALRVLSVGAKTLGLAGPGILGAALLKIDGRTLSIGDRYWKMESDRVDRPRLVLPEQWVEAVESVEDIDSVAQPLLDTLWQAFGVERCHYYDGTGKWVGK